MSERKKLKSSKEHEELDKIFTELANTPQLFDLNSDSEILEIANSLLNNMKKYSLPDKFFKCISEIMRITAPKCVFAVEDLTIVFEYLLDVLPSKRLDLSTFISFRVPALLKFKPLIKRYFDSFDSVKINKDYMEEMLAILIEESPKLRSFIPVVFKSNPFPVKFATRIFDFIDFEKLSDEEYCNIYIYCISKNQALKAKASSIPVRMIKLKEKYSFLESAIDVHKNEISNLYCNDKDKKVRCLIAKNCESKEVFDVLINDPDESVRIELIKTINWHSNNRDWIIERILDKNFNVRELIYKIYKDGVFELRDTYIFEKFNVKDGKLMFSSENNNNNPLELQEQIESFKKYTKKILEGCLTKLKDEYCAVLESCQFSMRFLQEIQEFPGASHFLKKFEIFEYENIPKEYKSLCLKYMFKGNLSKQNIEECLRDGILEALNHIHNTSEYFDVLLNKAIETKDIEISEIISEKIKAQLNNKEPILAEQSTNDNFSQLDSTKISSIPENESASFFNDVGNNGIPKYPKDNYYFINAHTKYSGIQLNNQEPLTYPELYFFSYQCNNDPIIQIELMSSNINLNQLVKILLIANKYELIEEFGHKLIKKEINQRILDEIVAAKNTNSALIYFLLTGCVSIKNPKFFVKAIKSTLQSKDKESVKRIFKKYIMKLDEQTFDIFNSVCWSLKCYKNKSNIAPNNSFIIINKDNNLEVRNENFKNENETPKDLQGKYLRLTKKDEMLYFISNFVIGSRNGSLVDFELNLEDLGFEKLTENEIEMIRYNQVRFE